MNHQTLLISDLDGTLLGDEEALEVFSHWCDQQRETLILAYSSGRLLDSVIESVRNTALPEPDAIISGVGTEIQLCRHNETLFEWQENFQAFDAGGICRVLARVHELHLQPSRFQSPHKVSYFAYDVSESFLRQVRQRLQDAGYPTNVIYSSNRDLDVLPQQVDKGSAAAFLASHLEIHPQQVIVSGDSGNDLSMFRQKFRGIVVGNAHQGLKDLKGDDVYHSNRKYAAGVLDGMDHWLGVTVV